MIGLTVLMARAIQFIRLSAASGHIGLCGAGGAVRRSEISMSISDAAAPALDQAERGLPAPNRSIGVDARPEGAKLEAARA